MAATGCGLVMFRPPLRHPRYAAVTVQRTAFFVNISAIPRDGNVTVTVQPDVYTDYATNGNLQSNTVWFVIDRVAPWVTVSADCVSARSPSIWGGSAVVLVGVMVHPANSLTVVLPAPGRCCVATASPSCPTAPQLQARCLCQRQWPGT